MLIEKEQKPDLIFITGDLVYGGQKDEYSVAEEFCTQLLTITGLTKQQLFIVLGNHDVDRGEVNLRHTETWYPFDSQDDISNTLSDPALSPILLKKLDNFYEFYNHFFEQELEFKNHFTIAQSINITRLNLNINLWGLNSALFAGYNGDDDKKLAFGLHQSEQAFQTMDADASLTIAFFHHPFSCFHACEEPIQSQIKQHADIILTGHLHDPSNMSQHDTSGKVLTVGAGASYETRSSENSFNLGVLNIETGTGTIQFYKYLSQCNRWIKNREINLDEGDDGHFPFKLPSIQAANLSVVTTTAPIKQGKEPERQTTLPASTIPQFSPKQVSVSIKVAILTANPINKNYEYSELLQGLKKLKCEIDYHYLSCDVLNDLENYDYIFILSKLIKNKIVIEDEYLASRTISLNELEENIFTTKLKGLFLLLNKAIDSELKPELSLATVIYAELSKSDVQKIIFQLFKKCNINSFEASYIANQDNIELCVLKEVFKQNRYRTHLPNEIDPRRTQDYIGRKTDLEILCKKIIDLKNERNGFLTLKGSGGIGKTLTIKKITVELAKRNFFPEGIDFIDCEFITDYKLFEFNLARTFNLEQSINVKEYIKTHEVSKGALLILDNFETLLHLSDKEEIKSFLNFICDYVTVVVTSRELLELDCEQHYDLRRFTTDEAMELFLSELNREISKQDELFIRNEIIESLLDNNPLAIKLVTKNLPKSKDFTALKAELEEDISDYNGFC